MKTQTTQRKQRHEKKTKNAQKLKHVTNAQIRVMLTQAARGGLTIKQAWKVILWAESATYNYCALQVMLHAHAIKWDCERKCPAILSPITTLNHY